MRYVMLLIAGVWVSGCDHQPPIELNDTIELRYGGQLGVETGIPLRMQQLESHADFDRVENAFKARAQESALIEAYEGLLENRPDDVLLATRIGNLRLRLGGVSQVPKVIPLAERLRKTHGSDANVKNLLAESAFYLLPRSHREGSFDLQDYPSNPPGDLSQGMGQPRAVAQTALRLWKEVLSSTDDQYRGAHGWNRSHIQKRVDALEGALRKTEAAARLQKDPSNLPAAISKLEQVRVAIQNGAPNSIVCALSKGAAIPETEESVLAAVKEACAQVDSGKAGSP